MVTSRVPTPAAPIEWVGSSLDDLRAFPVEVRREIGHALYVAQTGGRHVSAKPFGGAGVLEIVEDFGGDAYRAVYTLKLRGVVYVLHAFQKKSKRGISVPKRDKDVIEARLKAAAIHFRANYEDREKRV